MTTELEAADPYPDGQGDGTHAPVAPTVALVELTAKRIGELMKAGFLPWPPYEPVEAAPCAARDDVPASATTDGLARTLWCDRPAGHTDNLDERRHRTVTDLAAGSAVLWGGRCQAGDPETGQRCLRSDDLAVSHRDGYHQALAPGEPGLKVVPVAAGWLQEYEPRDYIRWPVQRKELTGGGPDE